MYTVVKVEGQNGKNILEVKVLKCYVTECPNSWSPNPISTLNKAEMGPYYTQIVCGLVF